MWLTYGHVQSGAERPNERYMGWGDSELSSQNGVIDSVGVHDTIKGEVHPESSHDYQPAPPPLPELPSLPVDRPIFSPPLPPLFILPFKNVEKLHRKVCWKQNHCWESNFLDYLKNAQLGIPNWGIFELRTFSIFLEISKVWTCNRTKIYLRKNMVGGTLQHNKN